MIATHPYNGSEISSTYTYSSSAWGDLLTGYNGTEIEYDAIGNPLNWHNAASMLWDGRKLTYFSEDALDHGIAFAYNSDGIRTKKTLYDYDGSTITHNYILDGSTILKETITSGSGTSTLYYYYDESGISGLEYNGTKYSYVKNLQGDVIRIINANGVTVVEYNYDAWGNILSTTGSMASTLGAANPFRYRGYYYDTESGWYYLNSRYYDPLVGRFINADGYVSTGQGLSGYNMFAYCGNNPVMHIDFSGEKPMFWNITSDEVKTLSLKRKKLTIYGIITVDIEVELTFVPDIIAAIKSTRIKVGYDESVTISTPDGFEVEIDLSEDIIGMPSFAQSIYEDEQVSISADLSSDGLGASFSYETDLCSVTGHISFLPFGSNFHKKGSRKNEETLEQVIVEGLIAVGVGVGAVIIFGGGAGRTSDQPAVQRVCGYRLATQG